MIFKNNNKNPNKLHDYLVSKNILPEYLSHNTKYNEDGEKVKEATEIYIEIEEEKQQELTNLVEQFMNS